MGVGGTRALSGWPSSLKTICTEQQVLGVLVRKPNKGYAHTVCLWVKGEQKERYS